MVRSASLGLSTSCLLDLPSCLFSCIELNWFSGINDLHCSNFLVLYAEYIQFGLRSWTILYIFLELFNKGHVECIFYE